MGTGGVDERFLPLLEAAPDAMIITDAAGAIALANAAAEKLFGYDRGELAGAAIEALVPERFRGRHGEQRGGYHAAPRVRPMGARRDLVALRKDGTEFAAEISLSPMETPEGRFVIAAVRDVTAQRQRLASAEQRYRALFEHAREAIGVCDADGVILEANRGWEEILGRPRAEIEGRRISDFVKDEARAPLAEGLRDAGGRREKASIAPVPYVHADGRVVQVELSRTVIALGDQTVVLGIARDVSERLRLAEQLRHAQKMEAVGRLAGGIAHDMNNILAAVITYAEFLAEGLPRGDPRLDDVAEIRKAAQRGAGLTRQLLTFSRQQALQPRVLDLNAVVGGILKMLRTLLGEDVAVETRLGPGLPPVRVDAGSFEQVLMNLAVNARDAMPDGGTLTITTSFDDGRVVLAVADTGTGMDAATRERIYEPFFTTKEPGKGTGLGLATVFGIVKQSGGAIEVESEPGRGTTFRIRLPAAATGSAERQEQTPPASAVVPSAGGEVVLVVEDDEVVRAAIVRTLRGARYQVVEASDGSEALAALERRGGAIHLLLTDVVLPGMSGAEVARRMREEHPGAKVLFMSGYADTTAHAGVPVGEPGFLQKPFTPDCLCARVRALLDAP